MGHILSIDNLRTYFFTPSGVIKAVDGITFSLECGQILGIVGESGSGKSMTALSILNLVPHPGKIVGGSVLFKGMDLLKIPKDTIRNIRGARISIVFQEPASYFNPVFTIGFQISETIREHLRVSKKEALEATIEILNSVGFPSPQERYRAYPHKLSGGMLQRAMIAMALCCNPEVILADEPTTALDVTIQAQILSLLKKIRNDRGASIILITHDFGIIAETADVVIVMYAGKIVERAVTSEIFDNALHPYTKTLLASLYKLSNKINNVSSLPPEQNLANQKKNCVFFDRCSMAEPACNDEEQALREKSAAHFVRCWKA